jgi:hypothetical protein
VPEKERERQRMRKKELRDEERGRESDETGDESLFFYFFKGQRKSSR